MHKNKTTVGAHFLQLLILSYCLTGTEFILSFSCHSLSSTGSLTNWNISRIRPFYCLYNFTWRAFNQQYSVWPCSIHSFMPHLVPRGIGISYSIHTAQWSKIKYAWKLEHKGKQTEKPIISHKSDSTLHSSQNKSRKLRTEQYSQRQ